MKNYASPLPQVPHKILTKKRYKWVLYTPHKNAVIISESEIGFIDCESVEDAHLCIDILLDLSEWDVGWIFDSRVGGWMRSKNETDACPHVLLYEE